MIFSWDDYNNLEYPEIYLADANKNYKYDGALHISNLVTELYFNNISTVSFELHKKENGKENPAYDIIDVGQLIEVKYIGWFQVTKPDIRSTGSNETKIITALSLENEFCSKTLTSFGQLGYEENWDGGLDLYCLYSLEDKKHSILHIVTEKCPAWKIGHVDLELYNTYRSFNVNEIDAYSFLMNTVSEIYKCIFIFDTFEQVIHAYKLENYGKLTDLYFSYENLIKKLNITCDLSDIRTVFHVTGGDDRSTSTLNIIEVNPNGTSYLYDFSYFKPSMTPELQNRLSLYEIEYQNRVTGFTNKVTKLQEFYEQLTELKMRVPKIPDSMSWENYGLYALETELAKYNLLLSQYSNYSEVPNSAYAKERYDELYTIIYGSIGNYSSSLKYALEKRKSEIKDKEAQITSQKLLCESATINLRDFLGEELFIELSRYVYEEPFNDSSFLATDKMTEEEILEMKKTLRDYAFEKLAEVSQPQYTLTVDSLNIATIPKFRIFAEQMYLGDIATLELSDGTCVEERMLKFVIHWDTKDFEIVFSNKNHLKDGSLILKEIQGQAQSTASCISIGGYGWTSAKDKKSSFDEYMKNVLNTAKQTLQNSDNQEFKIDNTGALLRRWMYEKNDYSPNQMWLTNNGIYLSKDSFRTVGMAIGEGVFNGENVYGVWVDLLCGRIVLAKTLYIDNKDSTFTIDNDGLKATNGINAIFINPNNNNGLFEVYKNGSKKMHLNDQGDLWLSGTVEASRILGSYFKCSNGMNEIIIDPDNKDRLFEINKNGVKKMYFNENGDLWLSGTITASHISQSYLKCTNGINTIIIDSNNNNCLFEISKGSKKQIYFDSDGNAVFEGYMTIGKIFSSNYKENEKGTQIDLLNGKFESHGLYQGNWISKTINNTTSTFIEDGFLRIRSNEGQGDKNPDLFFTAYGISTNKDATNATGVIEFLSKVYGKDFNGVTIQTGGSPLAFRSKTSSILIHPRADVYNNLLFRFMVDEMGNGQIFFGDFFQANGNKDYKSSILFEEDRICVMDHTNKAFSDFGCNNIECKDIEGNNIKASKIEITTGTLGGKDIATKAELDTLKTEWQNLLQTSYNNGKTAGYNSGYNAGYSVGYNAGINSVQN